MVACDGYAAAKAGDTDAAETLVGSLANRSRLTELTPLLQARDVRLLPVHALESEGVNEIPAALAELLSEWLSLPIIDSIVQSIRSGTQGRAGFSVSRTKRSSLATWREVGAIY